MPTTTITSFVTKLANAPNESKKLNIDSLTPTRDSTRAIKPRIKRINPIVVSSCVFFILFSVQCKVTHLYDIHLKNKFCFNRFFYNLANNGKINGMS